MMMLTWFMSLIRILIIFRDGDTLALLVLAEYLPVNLLSYNTSAMPKSNITL